MSRKLLITTLKYGLGFGVLAGVVAYNWPGRDGEPGLGDALQQPIHFVPFVLAGVICLCGVLLTFVRWFILVRAQELPFTLGNAMRLGLVGYFFNTLLPGSVGGDIVKATFIARAQSRRTVAVATVLLDRAIGLCGLFWLAALVGGTFWLTGMLDELTSTPLAAATLETIVIGAASIMAASVVFWIVLGVLSDVRAERFARRLARIGKIGPALAEFWRAVWMYRCRGRSVALALLLAMIGHVGFVLCFFFAAQTFSSASAIPSLGAHYLIVPVGETIRAGVPLPGGVGAAEFGYGELYKALDYSAALGVLAMLARRAIEWVLGFLAYLVYLRMKPRLHATAEPLKAGSAAGPIERGVHGAAAGQEAR